MVKIDLTKEEQGQIIQMLENSTIPMSAAEKALILLKKFREAKE